MQPMSKPTEQREPTRQERMKRQRILRTRRRATREDLGLTPAEYRTLANLSTPYKIQDFLDRIPANFEIGGETCLSVREVLRQDRALCIEGAFVAAAALWVHGEPPLLLDLKAEHDADHVVTLFRRNGRWGAISKTNHVPLRWRDPVYRSVRELAMSYVHEYANKRHQKTLRLYSVPLDLRRVDPALWVTNPKHCWEITVLLDELRHYRLMSPRQARGMRLRDATERRAQELLQWPKPKEKAKAGPR